MEPHTLTVSASVYEQLAAMAKQRGVSTDQLAEEMLGGALTQSGAVYQDHDEAKIKERLKSLGYID